MGNIRGGTLGFHGTIGQPTAQVIDGSLKFNGVNQHLTKTFSSSGNRRTFTVSYWIKESGKGSSPTNNPHIFAATPSENTRGGIVHRGTGSDANEIYLYNQKSNTTGCQVWTNSLHRDFSGWKHIVWVVDTTQATGTNRVKFYINGVQETLNFATTPAQYYEIEINDNNEHRIGRGYPDDYGNYYLSQLYSVPGQTLGPENFGFTDPQTNTWRPKKYTGTFGTNGFYLPLDNQDDFEVDKSGNGNDFSKSNFSGTFNDPNVLKDSPSGAVFGGRGQTGITTTSSAPANYATYNALDNHGNTLSNANLTASNAAGSWYASFGSIPSSDGRHYFEVTPTTLTTTCAIGVYVGNGRTDFNGNYPYDANTYMIHQNGYIYHAASTATYQTTYSANDTVGVAVDSKNRKVWISVNGSFVSGENPTTGIGGLQDVTGVGAMPDGEIYPVVSNRSATADINFGQKPFKYAPPQGFLPLNSASARPNKVVPRPDQYVGVTTYSGDNSEYRLLSLNHQPDFTWFKERGNTRSHILSDTVTGITKHLSTDDNGVQTSPSYPYVSSVDERGIVLRGGTSSGGNVSGRYYVAWTWKAGGNKNTFNVDDVGYATFAASGTTAGDITPTATSIGTKQGFSIIKYTGSGTSGDTLPHGLSQTPDLIITKCLDASSIDWIVKPVGLLSSESHMLILNGTNASFQGTGGHISAQTSTTVTLTEGSNDGNYNNTGDNYVMYAWHNVPGLQKFGSYIGGGSTYPFVELGFRPALIWIKDTSTSGNHYDWQIFDSTRDPINLGNDNADSKNVLFANLNSQENKGSNPWAQCDFLSNGFRMNDASVTLNNSGSTYIYCAWAEAPASNLFGGQSTAF